MEQSVSRRVISYINQPNYSEIVVYFLAGSKLIIKSFRFSWVTWTGRSTACLRCSGRCCCNNNNNRNDSSINNKRCFSSYWTSKKRTAAALMKIELESKQEKQKHLRHETDLVNNRKNKNKNVVLNMLEHYCFYNEHQKKQQIWQHQQQQQQQLLRTPILLIVWWQRNILQTTVRQFFVQK